MNYLFVSILSMAAGAALYYLRYARIVRSVHQDITANPSINSALVEFQFHNFLIDQLEDSMNQKIERINLRIKEFKSQDVDAHSKRIWQMASNEVLHWSENRKYIQDLDFMSLEDCFELTLKSLCAKFKFNGIVNYSLNGEAALLKRNESTILHVVDLCTLVFEITALEAIQLNIDLNNETVFVKVNFESTESISFEEVEKTDSYRIVQSKVKYYQYDFDFRLISKHAGICQLNSQ